MLLAASLACALLAPLPQSEDPSPRVPVMRREASVDPADLVDDAEGPAGVDAATWEEARRAADRALEWLAVHQSPAGYWQAHVGHKQGDDYLILRSAQGNESIGSGHIGVTAICGMGFLAGGHLPDRGRYGELMRRAVDYTVAHVTDSGLVTDGGTRMYSHAFATLFLAEIHGTIQEERIRIALEDAVHLIVDCQNAQGGWRYNAFTTEADMSVTVCQLQALRAARNIGIQVPKETIDRAMAYVLRARTRGGYSDGLFYYKTAGRGAWQKNQEYAINAAASTALLSAGVEDPELHDPVLEFLGEEYQLVHRHYADHYFYWYGNYYACQAFFHAGGPRFEAYQSRILRDLIRLQHSDGRYVNRTGPGDPFATGVAAIILQLPKQLLPIFQR